MEAPTILREDRNWYPAVYQDETMPEGRASPDSWLGRLTDGAHAWGEGETEGQPEWSLRAIEEGEILSFVSCDALGCATLVMQKDGFTVSRWFPADAFVWADGDVEMSGDGIPDLVANLRSFGEHEGEHEIRACLWSGEHFFRFTALDGPPRFEWVSSAGGRSDG